MLIYLDDLIIPSTDRDTGIKNLEIVLKIASETGLIINWKKLLSTEQSRISWSCGGKWSSISVHT